MIRIGIDCYNLEGETKAHRAGVGRHIYHLLEEIHKNKALKDTYRFYLYFRAGIPDDIPFLDNDIFVPKVAKLPFFLPFFRPSYLIYFNIALPIRLLLDRVKLIFLPAFLLPFICPAKSVVVLPNDIYYEMNNKKMPLRYRIGYKVFANNAALRATKIITQSYASRDEIQNKKFLRKRNIGVIPLGVHTIDVQNTKTVPKEKLLFYLGQAFPRRHLYETLLAFEKIADEFPDYSFLAVGVDRYNPPIIDKTVEEINARLGAERIKRKESITDEELLENFMKATVFFYISSSEGMGMPPLEALAYGTAPVVADTGTTREQFQDNAFFVANPDSVDEIADMMRYALQHPEERKKIEQNGKERMANYSWKRHADSMIELFEKMV